MVDMTLVSAEILRTLGTPRGVGLSIASFIGLAAAIVGSFARNMVRLRTFTVTSNVFLLIAAMLAPNPVSVLLFLILLPLNAWRLMEIIRLTGKVAQATRDGDVSGIWLKPYMRVRRYAAGSEIFRRGDPADEFYLLVEGTLDLVEIGQTQPQQVLFGEVAFFSPDRRRTLTARCATDCVVLSISESTFQQLYFQHPKFAFNVATLLGRRLSADVQRLRARVAELEQASSDASTK